MVGIERVGGEFADEALERMLAAASRQANAADMVAEVEVGVVAPEDAGGRALDQLTIAAIAEKALGDLGLDPSRSTGPSSIQTPTITMRLFGRSMRSQVVSTDDMRSL